MSAAAAELEWGIRRSFVQYVETLPDGVVAVGDDVQRRDGTFVLRGRLQGPLAEFAGAIRFSGHRGVLDVTLDGMTVRGIGARAAVWTSVAGEPVQLAVMGDTREEGGALRADEVTLTADGAALLGGVYHAGAALAPLTIRPARGDEKGI